MPWPWPLLSRRARKPRADRRQPILPMDEREADLLRRHRANREIREGES